MTAHQTARSWLSVYTYALSGAVSIGALVAATWALHYRKKYLRKLQEKDIRDELLDAFASPASFSLKEVKLATKNFAEENLIGVGGFGEVYKGTLSNGDLVAFKVLTREMNKGEAAFRTEVLLIANMRHQNLVMLRGFCAEGEARILVHEYLPNGSLDRHLFGANAGRDFPWDKRFRVALTTARGLAYLHDGCMCGLIIHRDLKPGNVLLTANFDARICDFGLARLASSEAGHASISGMAGTLGYLPPEAVTGKLTDKYDVFPYGVILLQLITGRKVVYKSSDQTHVICWVRERLAAGHSFASLADLTLQNRDDKQIEACAIVALLCVDEKPGRRPSMNKVVQMLVGNVPITPLSVRRGGPRSDSGSTNRSRGTGSELPLGTPSGTRPELQSDWDSGSQLQEETTMSVSTDSRESSEQTACTSFSSFSRSNSVGGWPQRRKWSRNIGAGPSRSWQRAVKLPHSRNLSFCGRESYLCEMHRKFQGVSGQVCLNINGMAGVGKTQLALEYAYRYMDEYEGVLWVDAAKDAQKNYAALARWLGIQVESDTSEEEQVEAVRNMLEADLKLLLILDNIDEEQLELLRPKVGACHVVLTTRIRLTYIAVTLQLEVMSIEDSLEVLRSRENLEEDCEPILREIAQKLGMLPWALSAAAQLLSNGEEPRRLLSRLTKDATKALEDVPVDLTFYNCNSLSGLFEDSINSLHSASLEDSELAVAMFDVAGFFSPQTIPITLLVLAAHFRLGHELESSEDGDDGEMAIFTLVRLNLAQRPRDKEVVFHCMLQAYSRSRDTDGSACAAVLRTLANSVLTRRTYPHMQVMWQLYEGRLTQGKLETEELERVIDVGIHITEYWLQLGTSHTPDTLKVFDDIISVGPRGGKMRMLARHAKVYVLLRVVYDIDTALQELKEVLSEITPELEGEVTTVSFRIMYAQLTWRPGETDEGDRETRAGLRDLSRAMDAFLEKVKVMLRQRTTTSPWGKYERRSRDLDIIAVALNNLGWLYTTYSIDYAKALELHGKVFGISQYVLHPRNVQQYGYGSLIHLYARLEGDMRAWRMLETAFSVQPGAIDTWMHLQSKLARKTEGLFGSPEERETKRRHMDDAVKFYSRLGTGEGKGNDWAVNNMAAALCELGLVSPAPDGERYLQQACAMLEQEISVKLQQAGRKTSEVNAAHFRLAVIHRYLGGKSALETSRRLLVECIRVEASLGVSSQQKMAGFLFHVGQLCLELGLLDEALSHLQRALRLRSQYYGRRSIRVSQVKEMLAASYWLQGEPEKAMVQLERTLGVRELHYEANDPQLTFLRQLLWNWKEGGENSSTRDPVCPTEGKKLSLTIPFCDV